MVSRRQAAGADSPTAAAAVADRAAAVAAAVGDGCSFKSSLVPALVAPR